MSLPESTVADDYARRGTPYSLAFRLMVESCKFVPSAEVFDHEVEMRRKQLGPHITPEQVARTFIANYFDGQPSPAPYTRER